MKLTKDDLIKEFNEEFEAELKAKHSDHTTYVEFLEEKAINSEINYQRAARTSESLREQVNEQAEQVKSLKRQIKA